jgi:hypothetical protein
MTMPTGSHTATRTAIFQHPVSRNLEWRDVRSMLIDLADVVEEHSDVLKIARNGQTLVLHRPYRKGMDDIQELMKVRRFIERSDPAPQRPAADGVNLLVVIDHRMARIYKAELHGSVPQRVIPFDLHGSGRHLHNVEDHADGQRKPEMKSFYEAIARTLRGGDKILVFGSGTGASSAMEHLLAELREHHADIFKRVVGSVVVDEPHLTENQLLAKARDFYSKPEWLEPASGKSPTEPVQE